MHAFLSLAALALLASTVHASIYVTNPVQASSCTGGQSCEVDWVDNGETPLLPQIGECEVGLYTGEYVLAQSLPSVDVSATSSFTFTVDPAAGPNGQYYLVFSADGVSYVGFSGSFTLTGMSGTTPGGGSSTSASATTAAGSSTSAGSTSPATSPTDTTASATPTDSVSATDTSTSPTVTTSSTTATTHSTTTTTTTTSRTTSASPSATSTSAAGRAGSSTSFSAVAALLALSGILAF